MRLPDVPPGIRLLGLTGAPGVGKYARSRPRWRLPVVPMDGFHYADVELVRRGLLDRKGAPETFDAEGYAALLRRVRAGEPDVVAPMFERDLEQPIAGAIAVPATRHGRHRGQLPAARRAALARAYGEQLDVVWHLHLDDAVRRERLVARHVEFGKTPDEARAWVARVDEANAALVEARGGRADLVVDLSAAPPRTPPA